MGKAINGGSLSEPQRATFFELMKPTIVRVTQENAFCGGGVLISEKGHVLTTTNVFREEEKGKLGPLLHDEDESPYSVVVLDYDQSLGLALLKIQNTDNKPFEHAMVRGANDVLPVGMEVHFIGHYFSLITYCYFQGSISNHFQSARPIISNMERFREQLVDMFEPDLVSRSITSNDVLGDMVQLIELNNIHGDQGSAGAPFSDVEGHIIGFYFVAGKDRCFGVHLNSIQQYLKSRVSRFIPSFRSSGCN